MPDWGTLLIVTVGVALVFNFTNGFHDTANAIATVVSTRVFTITVAILVAAVLNFVGALVSTNVAKTIGSEIIDTSHYGITNTTILAALLGAILWKLGTWYLGLPSSSTHALIGGLVGATLVSTAGYQALNWEALLVKVLLPLLLSPVIGFGLAYLFMALLRFIVKNMAPGGVNHAFRRLQVLLRRSWHSTTGRTTHRRRWA